MKKIITISREFGAGGGEIGKKLAKRLDYDYYDKELILMAAAQADIDVSSLIEWDEKVPVNFGFTQSLFNFYNRPMSEKIFEAQKQVIRKIGEKGRCVIVGRNANAILREYDDCLNVFVHADFAWRLNRMKDRMENMTEAQAADEIRAIDRVRKKYCAYYTNEDFGSVGQYDIALNSSRLGIEACVDALLALAGDPGAGKA